MFPSRAPFSRHRLGARAAEIAAYAEENTRETSRFPQSPFPRSSGKGQPMSELAFLSPDRARSEDLFEPRFASPLARVLAGSTAVGDLSHLGKIEVRGDVDAIEVDAEVVRITPRRALVLCPYEQCADLRALLPGTVIDMTGALAGLELEGEQAMPV